jgi:hypothetical protein
MEKYQLTVRAAKEEGVLPSSLATSLSRSFPAAASVTLEDPGNNPDEKISPRIIGLVLLLLLP